MQGRANFEAILTFSQEFQSEVWSVCYRYRIIGMLVPGSSSSCCCHPLPPARMDIFVYLRVGDLHRIRSRLLPRPTNPFILQFLQSRPLPLAPQLLILPPDPLLPDPALPSPTSGRKFYIDLPRLTLPLPPPLLAGLPLSPSITILNRGFK